MKQSLIAASLSVFAFPAVAAGEVFFSLKNTDFVVLLGFLLFIAILIYFKIPAMLLGMLDSRAETIRSELDEAKALREEAQAILASYERKHKEVKDQAERIVDAARKDAEAAAVQAKEDLKVSIARRLQAAEDQIASAEASAIKAVRDSAVTMAVAAAADVVSAKTSSEQQGGLIDAAIAEVEAKLH